MASNKNLFKSKYPWIDAFDHEGITVINAMHYRTVVVFEHLEITSKIDLDIMIKYNECILIGSALKNQQVLLAYKE